MRLWVLGKKVALAKYLAYVIFWPFYFITAICLMQILSYFISAIKIAKKLQ